MFVPGSAAAAAAAKAAAKIAAQMAGANIGELVSMRAANEVADTPEIAAAKQAMATELDKIKAMESKDDRQRKFKKLLIRWHPDKNQDKIEVATEVFQMLQKSKQHIRVD